MLVSEIATRVRRQMGDDTSQIIQDADIIRWVNDAQMEISTTVDILAMSATAATISGVSDYTMPLDTNRIYSLKWQGQRLRQVSLQQAEELFPSKDNAAVYPQGSPSVFWTWGNIFTLYPAPSTSGNTDLRVFYYRNPAVITAVTQTPELPTEFHLRIVEYCIAQAADIDDDSNKYAVKINEFKSGVRDGIGQDREVQYYPFITDIDIIGWSTID